MTETLTIKNAELSFIRRSPGWRLRLIASALLGRPRTVEADITLDAEITTGIRATLMEEGAE